MSFGGEAMEQETYLCLDTGHIYWHSDYADNEEEPLPDDIDDTEKYAAIPHKNDLDLGKQLVSRFIEEHMPEDYETVRMIFPVEGRMPASLMRRFFSGMRKTISRSAAKPRHRGRWWGPIMLCGGLGR
uniref:Uncharacterized protein n=1 Tax=Candidatus Kentrum sp. FW TaxID=2126338 RepID=A0A450TZU1_9GAMM|nr:MAG: hypothetical protein BECKFW1821C_GA0114237_107816 [Candidatus Kentron sp. FW]